MNAVLASDGRRRQRIVQLGSLLYHEAMTEVEQATGTMQQGSCRAVVLKCLTDATGSEDLRSPCTYDIVGVALSWTPSSGT